MNSTVSDKSFVVIDIFQTFRFIFHIANDLVLVLSDNSFEPFM